MFLGQEVGHFSENRCPLCAIESHFFGHYMKSWNFSLLLYLYTLFLRKKSRAPQRSQERVNNWVVYRAGEVKKTMFFNLSVSNTERCRNEMCFGYKTSVPIFLSLNKQYPRFFVYSVVVAVLLTKKSNKKYIGDYVKWSFFVELKDIGDESKLLETKNERKTKTAINVISNP